MSISGRSSRTPLLVSTLSLAAAMLCALPSSATDFRGAEELTVAAHEIVDGDLYASGETITVDGVVRGDLVAAGRVIRINGTIEGDLIAAAQAVVISGVVTDDVRMAGQALQIGGDVGGHVVAFGFSLEMLPEGRIGEDLVFRGAQALLAGTIAGDLSSASQGLELRGLVAGAAEISVGADSDPQKNYFWPPPIEMPPVRGGLLVTDEAVVEGRLVYRAPALASIAPGAAESVEAEIAPPEEEVAETSSVIPRLAAGARRFLALFVLGALLLWLAPAWTGQQVRQLRTRPWPSLAWGLVGVAGAATLSLLLFGLGIALAVALGLIQLGNLSLPTLLVGGLGALVVDTLLVVGLFWIAQVVVGLGVGSLILRRTGTTGRQAFAALGLGLLLYVLLRLLPVVGWIIGVLVALLGFGAVLEGLVRDFRNRRAPTKEATA